MIVPKPENIKKQKQNKKYRRPKKDYLSKIATVRNDPDTFLGYKDYYPNPTLFTTEIEQPGQLSSIAALDYVLDDDTVNFCVNSRIQTLTNKEWAVLPPDNPSNEEKEAALFIDSTLRNTNFDQAREDILLALIYGYYGVEVIYKITEDNLVGVNYFCGKHPRRLVFTGNDKDSLKLLTKKNSVYGEEVPPKKFLVMTYGSTENPYGKGLGTILYWLVWYKHNCTKFWLKLQEKFGTPTLVGQAETPNDQENMLDAMGDILTNANIVIPNSADIKALAAGGTGAADFEKFIVLINESIVKLIQSQLLTSGSSGTGSYALGKVQQSTFQNNIEADGDLLDYVFQQLVNWLTEFNFPNITKDRYPVINTYSEAKPDLKEAAEIDVQWADRIPIPLQFIREKYGYPEPVRDEPTTITYSNSTSSQEDVTALKRMVSLASDTGSKFTPEQEVVEEIVSETIDLAGSPLDKIVKQLKVYLSQGKDLDSIQRDLFNQYSEISMDAVESLIEKAVLKVQTHGTKVASKKVDDLNASRK